MAAGDMIVVANGVGLGEGDAPVAGAGDALPLPRNMFVIPERLPSRRKLFFKLEKPERFTPRRRRLTSKVRSGLVLLRFSEVGVPGRASISSSESESRYTSPRPDSLISRRKAVAESFIGARKDVEAGVLMTPPMSCSADSVCDSSPRPSTPKTSVAALRRREKAGFSSSNESLLLDFPCLRRVELSLDVSSEYIGAMSESDETSGPRTISSIISIAMQGH